jgi:hypothetical protein
MEIVNKMDRLIKMYNTLDLYVLQNDALLRHEYETRTVLEIFDTISEGSYFAKHSKLQVVNEPEEHFITLYFDSTKMYPVNFFNYDIYENDIEKIRINIGLKLYLKENGKGGNICVVVKLLKNEKTIVQKSDYLNNAKPGEWYDYQFSFTCKKDEQVLFDKGNLKAFMYNAQQEGYIDDIKVEFFIEKNK